MKINISCEHFKPTNRNGIKEKCHCKFLNRNFNRDLKIYSTFMKGLEKRKK